MDRGLSRSQIVNILRSMSLDLEFTILAYCRVTEISAYSTQRELIILTDDRHTHTDIQ